METLNNKLCELKDFVLNQAISDLGGLDNFMRNQKTINHMASNVKTPVEQLGGLDDSLPNLHDKWPYGAQRGEHILNKNLTE